MRQGTYELKMRAYQVGNKQGRVFLYGDYLILKSYQTVVAIINTRTHKFYIRDYYSITTARHINKFLTNNNFKPIYKKDYDKYLYPYSWQKFINIIIKKFNGYAV